MVEASAGSPTSAPGCPTVVIPVRIGNSPVMKFARPAATRLGVIVGEPHALGRQLIEIRRPTRHYAFVIRANVEPADVIAHNDDDIGFLVRGLRRREDTQ